MREASIADLETLQRYDSNACRTNVTTTIDTSPQSISFKGWTFSSLHGPILDSDQRDSLASEIAKTLSDSNSSNYESIRANDDKILLDDRILRLPSAIFDDYVTISNSASSSTFTATFRSKDALVCWANQHSSGSIEVLQVPYASSWKEKQEYRLGKGSDFVCNEMRKWDWTFSTEYDCTCDHQTCDGGSSSSTSSLFRFPGEFSTGIKYILNATNLTTSNDSNDTNMNNRGGWLQTDKSGIDIAMLSQTNVPILFYDEVMLYQDDLDDCGESTLDIKIRVMPDCWFVLKRLFVRVDDVKVRIRDCRLFHKFGEAAIHMEITWKESTLPLPQHIQSALIKSAVQSSGLPMHAVSSQSLPPSVLLKSGPLAQHLPSIMEYEKLHPFYAFII
jgi:hypothetical protein